MTPDMVTQDNNQHGYYCRRCQHKGTLSDNFEFKHPTKKNLPINEAIRMSQRGPGWFGKLFAFLFSKGA
jgi:hypothetical protein